jgi:hypothetical protein
LERGDHLKRGHRAHFRLAERKFDWRVYYSLK